MCLKIFKRLFFVFAVIALTLSIFSLGTKTFAKGLDKDEETPDISDSQTLTYDDYIKGIEEGYIGEDVSFDELKTANEEASMDQLEENLISNGFEKVYDSEVSALTSSYTMKKGDVLVSSRTSSSGLTGHAAIAITSSKILHIAGSGHKPATHSFSWFKEHYGGGGKMKMYRISSATAATKAADWVKSHYEGSDSTYRINNNLDSTNTTYCSKIVYQGYYFGAHAVAYLGTALVLPYALPNILSYKYSVTKKYTY
ncbi:hypothetical protein [Heyndrickxia ginsengihumi]|uniref:hypothetical protein n=1 Tax=Heyndrickxia ginsengihumi TaxID=363870 RepID=UPI00203FE3DC|nr:hypothetical protein [Heyndrickxia ginsengihumi]MCM3024621.1 hypothetical protein [Heyndrickxia ginsengihumi]